MSSRLIFPVAKVAVSGGLIWWILRDAELGEISASIRAADVGLLAAAFAMFFIGYFITVSRWRTLLAAQGIEAPFLYLLRSVTVAIFFNNFLPSTIGGDLVRMYDSYRLGHSRTGSVSVVLIDRFFGVIALLVYASLALALAPAVWGGIPLLPVWVAGGLGMVSLVLYLIFGSPDWFMRGAGKLPLPGFARRLIAKVAAALQPFKGRNDVLLKALGLSFVLQLNVIVHFVILTRAMHIDVPTLAMFVIIPVAAAAMMIPVSINAIGVREAAFVYLFSIFGVPNEQSVAFAWVAFGFVLAQGVIGGVVFALRRATGDGRVPCRSDKTPLS